MTKLILGADHRGFKLKEQIKKVLDQQEIEYKDVGAKKLDSKDDYVDYAKKAAKEVNKGNYAILICGSGIGMSIAANKHKGVYAALVHDVKEAKLSRQHNNSNMLCLNNMPLTKAKKIIKAWVETPFSQEQRHKRRINKIKRIEKTQ